MSIKPHVDTVNVEGMVAIGQNAGFLVVFELGQANGASKWSQIAGLGYVRVNKGGDCFNDRKVQTFGSSSSGGRRGNGGGNGEQVLSTTPAEVAATAVPEEERSVVMEAEEDEQDYEEKDTGAEHYFAIESIINVFGLKISVVIHGRKENEGMRGGEERMEWWGRVFMERRGGKGKKEGS